MVRLIIGLLVFWTSSLGIFGFLNDKLKIQSEFIPMMEATFIGLALYIAGILNVLLIVVIIICAFGLLSFCYYLTARIKNRNKHVKLESKSINVNWLFICGIFLYITVIGSISHITHFDCFSHWAIMVQTMLEDNALPNFEDTNIMAKVYQPGSSVFVYYVAYLCGGSEGAMIIGQNTLIFSFVSSLFAYTEKNKEIPSKILISAFYVFTLWNSISFNNLLVDSLIACVLVGLIALLFYYRKTPDIIFWCATCIFVYLVLIKTTGLVLAAFGLLYMLFIYVNNKDIKKGISRCAITFGGIFVGWYVWQRHVSMAFGNETLSSGANVNADSMLSELSEKGFDKIEDVLFTFIKRTFDYQGNIINKYVIAINIILILIIILSKSKRAGVLLAVTVDLFYIAYSASLCLMYIVAMSYVEAEHLASYERYMTTALIIMMGIIVIYLLNTYIEKTFVRYIVMFIVCCMILYTGFFWRGEGGYFLHVGASIGSDDYEGSAPERYDQIIETIPIDNNEIYYVYSPYWKTHNELFLFYVTRYKLDVTNVEIVGEELSIDSNDNGYFILFDAGDGKLKNKLKELGWKKNNKNVYEK